MSGAPMEELREALQTLASEAHYEMERTRGLGGKNESRELAALLSSALEELARLRRGDPFGLAQVPPTGPCQRCTTNQATHHRAYCENCIQDLVIVEGEQDSLRSELAEVRRERDAKEAAIRQALVELEAEAYYTATYTLEGALASTETKP